MKNLQEEIEQFSMKFKQARVSAGFRQEDLAKRIGASRDLIVRIERGDNVGIHSVLSALAELGNQMQVGMKVPESAKVVRNFDQYYAKNIRNKLEADLAKNPNEAVSFVNRRSLGSLKVKNWARAAKV